MPLPIASLVGAGIGAIGSIFGGIAASKAAKRARQGVMSSMRDNQTWYDRRYNEDALQRADALRTMERTREAIAKRNQRAQAVQAVMGGTEESVQAEREAGNEALSNVASAIAADGAKRKDLIESQYIQRRDGLQQQLNQIEANRAQGITQAIGGVVQAGAGIASAFDPQSSK